MASVWGKSWGFSWGSAWGSVLPPIPPQPQRVYSGGYVKTFKKDKSKIKKREEEELFILMLSI